MKKITVKTEETYIDEPREHGISMIMSDAEEEATLCDLSLDFATKLVPKAPVEKFWEELQKINFQKVFHEDEKMIVTDGFFLTIELEQKNRTLSLILYNPIMKAYRESGCTESCKLLRLIKKIVKYAKEEAIDFEVHL